jgi:hypothetical protein
MSTATARRASTERTERKLSVVPAPPYQAPRTPFVIVVVAILAAGLVGLLLLNTALAQGSFRVHDLQRKTAALQDREQQLQIAVDSANNPARLAAAARHLGLVAADDPGFLRLSDGRILGEPHAATPPPKKAPVATASPKASATPVLQPTASTATKPTTHASTQPSTKPSTHPPHPTPAPGVHR